MSQGSGGAWARARAGGPNEAGRPRRAPPSARLRRLTLAALLALPLLALAGAPAAAGTGVAVEVLSVRDRRVYVRSERPQDLGVGAVVLARADGSSLPARIVARSSLHLVLEPPDGAPPLDLAAGERLTLSGGRWTPPAGASAAGSGARPAAGEAEPARAEVVIGRRAPTLDEFQAEQLPEREQVPYRRPDAPRDPDLRGGSRLPSRAGAEAGAGTGAEARAGTGREDEAEAMGLPANVVRGRVEVGVDGVYDRSAGVSRTTPFARLRLEVRRLGGSDRARLLFNGAVRFPIKGERDWTGHNAEQVQFRLTAVALEVEALGPGQAVTLTDRVELGLGRLIVPDVVEAGLVDGARVGLRLGPLTPFFFAGLAASPNPRREDVESVIYGGGVRFARAFSHAGALRLSVAGAQERWRSEGTRDFLEARGHARYGVTGAHAALVVDFFSPLKDAPSTRITTALLSAYTRPLELLRLDAGYRQHRPQYQKPVIDQDLGPLDLAFLQRSARHNAWAGATLSLPHAVELRLRGDWFEGRDTRDGRAVSLGVAWEPRPRHRLDLELALQHRLKDPSGRGHSTDPSLVVSHTYRGEAVTSTIWFAWRDSLPKHSVHDRRFAARLDLDGELGGGFGLRGFVQLDLRRTQGPARDGDGVTAYLGLAARYRF